MSRLREYRERFALTQDEVVAAIRKRALARGDVAPGLDRPALSKHENGHKRPGPYYQQLYCEIYGATPAALGFRVALPGETSDHDDVNRREFLAGTAGFVASATLAPVASARRVGNADVAGLRRSVVRLYRLDEQHGGAGAVYPLTVRTFDRLRGLIEGASYGPAPGHALRELAGLTAEHAGWLSFDAGRHEDARRWWLEAMHWSRLAESDSVSVVAMASMALQAFDRRPRETIELATAAQRIAGSAATPRLTSVLLVREALGHAGADDGASARTALRRARGLAEQPRHDDDPSWIYFYGPADFASHEHHVAMMLGDLPAAEDAARTAVSLNDSVAYARTHALYLIQLADVLAQRRNIDESATAASQAATAATDLDSGRVTRGLHAVARRLAPYRDEPAVGEFLAQVA